MLNVQISVINRLPQTIKKGCVKVVMIECIQSNDIDTSEPFYYCNSL